MFENDRFTAGKTPDFHFKKVEEKKSHFLVYIWVIFHLPVWKIIDILMTMHPSNEWHLLLAHKVHCTIYMNIASIE